jgi:hypothetical protein
MSLSHYLKSRSTAFYLTRISNGPDIVFHIQSAKDTFIPVFFRIQEPKVSCTKERFAGERLEITAEDL